MTDFTLPELGENITSGDVLRVLVKPGDALAKDQTVLELETDKATIEVPSSVAGQVKDVKVKAGDKVKVGQAILSVDDGASAPAKQAEAKPAPAKAEAAKTNGGAKAQEAAGANTAAKVPGDGGLEQHVEGEKRAEAADKPAAVSKVVDITRGARAAVEPPAGRRRSHPPRPRCAGWRASSAWTSTRSPARARTAGSRSTTSRRAPARS